MMAHSNQWAFVIAAYALTALGTFGLLLHSWVRMRGAEARAHDMRGAEARAQDMRGAEARAQVLRNDSAHRDAGHSGSAREAIAPDLPGTE
jgi:hypothetical protein